MEALPPKPASERGLSSRPRLECRSVSSGYLGSPVLRGISFSIGEPAIYVVLGPNGAGKTTLFRTLAGILRPTDGEVRVDGETIDRPGALARLHYLSHIDGIPDGLTVRAALDYYARVERASSDDVERVLDRLEIRDLSDRYVAQLSAGQRKRVSVARVFLRERGIYLLDEPTSNLDPKSAREIRARILELSRERIVLYSSHNLFEAREIGEYVLLIRGGRLATFDRIENVKGARCVIGVRLLEPLAGLPGFERRGDYLVRELSDPGEVPGLIRELEGRGARIREVREMDNPLEDLFA